MLSPFSSSSGWFYLVRSRLSPLTRPFSAVFSLPGKIGERIPIHPTILSFRQHIITWITHYIHLMRYGIPFIIILLWALGTQYIIGPWLGTWQSTAWYTATLIAIVTFISFERACRTDPGTVPAAWMEWNGQLETRPPIPSHGCLNPAWLSAMNSSQQSRGGRVNIINHAAISDIQQHAKTLDMISNGGIMLVTNDADLSGTKYGNIEWQPLKPLSCDDECVHHDEHETQPLVTTVAGMIAAPALVPTLIKNAWQGTSHQHQHGNGNGYQHQHNGHQHQHQHENGKGYKFPIIQPGAFTGVPIVDMNIMPTTQQALPIQAQHHSISMPSGPSSYGSTPMMPSGPSSYGSAPIPTPAPVPITSSPILPTPQESMSLLSQLPQTSQGFTWQDIQWPTIQGQMGTQQKTALPQGIMLVDNQTGKEVAITSTPMTSSSIPIEPTISDPYTIAYCDHCHGYKPPRTHHCSRCRRCITRMDHHCEWMGKCIGYGNIKFFILFLCYATLGLIYAFMMVCFALYNMYYRIGHIPSPWSLSSSDGGLDMYLVLLISYIFGRFAATTTWFHIKNLKINITQLEEMFQPPISWPRYSKGKWMANVADVFGDAKWTWPLPI